MRSIVTRTVIVILSSLLAWFASGCSKEQLAFNTPPSPGPRPPDLLAPGPSSESFPLRVAYQSWFKDERVEFFNASGACTGLATAKFEVAVPAEFEGINGFQATQTITFASPACTALNLPLDMTRHVDARYAPIGESFAGRDYAVLSGAVTDLPVTIRLFDTLNYANLLLFSDRTKSVPMGSRSLSFAAEVDTVSTVLLAFTARDFDNAGTLKRTRTDQYRLFGNGYMTLRAIDFQDNSTGLSLSLRLVNG